MPVNVTQLVEDLLITMQSAEKRHRAIYERAFNNDDFETTKQEAMSIPNIIRWCKTLETLRTEITEQGIILEEDVHQTQALAANITNSTMLTVESEEDTKIGQYIRSKLRELSIKGFSFTYEQILNLCDADWSRDTFSYDRRLSFAKLYSCDIDISAQIKDSKGYNRYWNEIFEFGDYKLLIISQWYSEHKDRFDLWYEKLITLPVDKVEDTVIIHIKRQGVGENIVTVSSTPTPLLVFPIGNVVISARLDGEAVAFRAVVNGISQKETMISVSRLQKIRTLEEVERFHMIAVPYNINTSKQMRFMAWIDPDASSISSDESADDLTINLTNDLSDDLSSDFCTDRKPRSITLFGKKIEVKSWDDIFIKVCKEMALRKPYVVATFNQDKELNAAQTATFSYDKSEIKLNPKKLTNSLWIESEQNAKEVIKLCENILAKCNFSPSDLRVDFVED